MNYGWIITQDHLGDGEEGTMGPNGITLDMEKRLRDGGGELFRLYDDDGYLYYTGRQIGCYGGEPLFDFGAPNAGCTFMKEKIDGKWKITVG